MLDKVEYHGNKKFIEQINAAQSSWRAKLYPQFEGKTLGDMLRIRGGLNSRFSKYI